MFIPSASCIIIFFRAEKGNFDIETDDKYILYVQIIILWGV